MKVIFTPISIIMSLVAGVVGKKIFERVWALFDDEEPPESEHRDASWAKVIAAAAVSGAIFRMTKMAVDRGLRTAFASTTGTWPGEEQPDQK